MRQGRDRNYEGSLIRPWNKPKYANSMRMPVPFLKATQLPLPNVVRQPGHPAHNEATFYSDTVDCTCWCERTVVKIPTRAVWDGQTASCGHEECHA